MVLSQDTDLVEPVRIVRDEIKKDIGVVCLDGRKPGKLAGAGSFVRHITASRLAASQFPETLPFGNKGKSVTRPVEWKRRNGTAPHIRLCLAFYTVLLCTTFVSHPASS